MVRLWVNGEDYGVMSERAAEMYIEVHREWYPEQPVYPEPVADASPIFLLHKIQPVHIVAVVLVAVIVWVYIWVY